MGRFCVQRVALSVHARASRAMKREAGGFRLRDAMRACGALACAQRARVAPRRPRGHDDRMFTAGKNLSQVGPINGLRTGTPPTADPNKEIFKCTFFFFELFFWFKTAAQDWFSAKKKEVDIGV